jgi:hypothetical protein
MFYTLHRSRTAGFADWNPLTLQDFVAYYQLFPEPSEERRAVEIRILQRVDEAVREKLAQRQAAKQ